MKNEQSVDADSMCVELLPGVTARVAKDANPELIEALKAVAKHVSEDPPCLCGHRLKDHCTDPEDDMTCYIKHCPCGQFRYSP